MTCPEDFDPDPWWADDHRNDGLGPVGIDQGRVEDDMRPSPAEADAEAGTDRRRL